MAVNIKSGLLSREWVRQHSGALTAAAIVLGMLIALLGSMRTIEFFSFGILNILIHYPITTPLEGREIVFLVIAYVVTLSILGLIIRARDRSLWFLGIFIIPMSWLAFFFIRDHGKVYRFGLSYWKGVRQFCCWLGLLALVVLILVAVNWDVPLTRPIWNITGDDPEVFFVKNFDEAPAIIHLAGQYFFYAIIIGGMLIYGALHGETADSPEFKRSEQWLVRES